MADERADLAWFIVERHLDPMIEIVESIGDEHLNTEPGLPGANSAYVLLWHSVEVVAWWTRNVILGLDHPRDRDSEFTATGTVASVVTRAREVREQFLCDLKAVDLDAEPRGEFMPHFAGTPIITSARGVLLHLLEELAQHHGHLQLTRDLLLRSP